ncbi:MAG: polyprenol monophosphomannose synthase [Actinomycetota bacterium]|nr:polyprenol monophosphomannose synthase [Actinomycetota bacterium]
MSTATTLVLLPTFQERDNIETVLRQLREAVPLATVLVIDDASPDGTADVAEELGRELGHIEVMRRHEKNGLGTAYRAGAAWGLERGFELIVQMDADLSHDPLALPQLLDARERHDADLVIGSRYVPGGSIPDWTRRRRLLSKAANVYARLWLGLRIRDATTGYRVWTAAAIKDVDMLGTRAEGYGFVIESNFRASRQGHSVVEVPIVFRDRARGKSKMSGRIIIEALVLVTRWGIEVRATQFRRRK